jgi:methionyl-tRNA formyltransferase
MGTPDFSVPALQRLAEKKDFFICLVVTQPDRPKGRGKRPAPSPVKAAALALGLEVYQPKSLNTDEAWKKLSSLSPDFFVVAAFGQMLSKKILDIPKVFPINIHASLLPKYRGASPIQAAILNMDTVTGVTTMVMAETMDAGDILLASSTPIKEDDTAQDLHDRLGLMGADLICKTIYAVLEDTLSPAPQDPSKASYVKLLKKKDGLINWDLSARQIQAHINAMTPWPGAFTRLEGRTLKIYRAKAQDPAVEKSTGENTMGGHENSSREPGSREPGVIFRCDGDGIHVTTGNGSLIILELMGASGKRLTAGQFLCGRKIELPQRFDPE